MGTNMVERLLEKGYSVVAEDMNEKAVQAVAEKGAEGAHGVEELVSKLADTPRLIWIMVPHQVVDDVLENLTPLLAEGDRVIDGGNSFYKDSVRRARELKEKGIHLLDVGVSGGPEGALEGASMMIGGERELFEEYEQLFDDLTVEGGYGYMGESGAGHFVKMVHNGIEYGMMQAIAEGFTVMKKSDFDLDLAEVARVYNHGTVIQSNLIEWLYEGYDEYGIDLSPISGEVDQSGEGKWTMQTAEEWGIRVPIIEEAVQFRLDSQGNPSYTGKVVSLLRHQFGGHEVKKEE